MRTQANKAMVGELPIPMEKARGLIPHGRIKGQRGIGFVQVTVSHGMEPKVSEGDLIIVDFDDKNVREPKPGNEELGLYLLDRPESSGKCPFSVRWVQRCDWDWRRCLVLVAMHPGLYKELPLKEEKELILGRVLGVVKKID